MLYILPIFELLRAFLDPSSHTYWHGLFLGGFVFFMITDVDNFYSARLLREFFIRRKIEALSPQGPEISAFKHTLIVIIVGILFYIGYLFAKGTGH